MSQSSENQFNAMLERVRTNDPTLLTVPDRHDKLSGADTVVSTRGRLEKLAAALHGNMHCLVVHVNNFTANPWEHSLHGNDRAAELLLEAMEHCAVQVVSFGDNEDVVNVEFSGSLRQAFLDAPCMSRFLRAVREDDEVLPALTDCTIHWGSMHPSPDHIRLLANALVHNTHFEELNIEAHSELRQRDFDPLLLSIPQCALECVVVVGRLAHSESTTQAVRAKLTTALLPNLLQGQQDEDSPTVEARYLDFEDSEIQNEHVGLITDTIVSDTSIKKIFGLRIAFHSERGLTPEAVEVLMKSESSVYSVAFSDQSSMFLLLDATPEQHAREVKMRENIQKVCVPRALAMIASDDDCIRKLIVDETWTAHFKDADAEKLARALETNTKLETLSATPDVTAELTDEGMGHLERVISAPSCAISEVLFAESDADDDDSVANDVSFAKRIAIECQCMENGMRRLRTNDLNQTVLTCTGHSGFLQFEELASLLLRNAEQYHYSQPLRLNFCGNKQLTDPKANLLLAALKHPNACHVQSMQLEETDLSPEQERALHEQMSLNLQRNEQRSDSIEDHRPLQRLLLSSIYRSNSVQFTEDILLLVVEHLQRSSVCPYMHSDGSVHPEHASLTRSIYANLPSHFLWHKLWHRDQRSPVLPRSDGVSRDIPKDTRSTRPRNDQHGSDAGVEQARGSDDDARSGRRPKRHKR
eukprot:COSAG02_NODE_53_length_44062_cov_22.860223_3_plen_700_part_00